MQAKVNSVFRSARDQDCLLCNVTIHGDGGPVGLRTSYKKADGTYGDREPGFVMLPEAGSITLHYVEVRPSKKTGALWVRSEPVNLPRDVTDSIIVQATEKAPLVVRSAPAAPRAGVKAVAVALGLLTFVWGLLGGVRPVLAADAIWGSGFSFEVTGDSDLNGRFLADWRGGVYELVEWPGAAGILSAGGVFSGPVNGEPSGADQPWRMAAEFSGGGRMLLEGNYWGEPLPVVGFEELSGGGATSAWSAAVVPEPVGGVCVAALGVVSAMRRPRRG